MNPLFIIRTLLFGKQKPEFSNHHSRINNKGFTLVEILVAMVLASLLTVVIAKTLLTNTRVLTKNTINSQFQTDARYTLRYLKKDFKSATKTISPAIGKSSNNLSIKTLDKNGTPKTISYNLGANGNLNRQNRVLAKKLVNAANTLFTRPTQNTLRVKMKFSDTNMKPKVDFTFEAILNLKSAVALTLEDDSLTLENLNSGYFLNPDNGWVAGNNGTILNYASGVWTQKSSPVTYNLNSVKMLGNSLGYIASNSGKILQYNGTGWTNQDSATPDNLYDISPTDLNKIYAVGGNSAGTAGAIGNYNGTSWNNEAVDTKQLNSFSQNFSNKYAVGNKGYIYSPQLNMVGINLQLDSSWSTGGGGWMDVDVADDGFIYAATSSSPSIMQYNLNGSYTGRNWGSGGMTSIAVDNNNGNIYASSHATGMIYKINMATGEEISLKYDAGGSVMPYGLDIDPVNKYVYITDWNKNLVVRTGFNLESPTTFISSVFLPWSIKVDNTKNLIYIGDATGIHKYDFDGNLIGLLSTVGWAHDIELDSYGNLWTVTGGSVPSLIYRINTITGTTEYSKPSPSDILGIALDSNDNVYVGHFGSSNPTINLYSDTSGTLQNQWYPLSAAPFGSENLNGSSIVAKQNNPLEYYLWVVGNNGTILRYDSETKGWNSTIDGSIQSPTSQNLNSVYFVKNPDGTTYNGYIVGDKGAILRYNGSIFEPLEPPQGAENTNLSDIFLYSNDGGWIVGDSGTRIKIGEF